MVTTLTFLAFVAWALICLDLFGLFWGAALWVLTFVLMLLVLGLGRRLVGDPMLIYDRERAAATRPSTDSGL